MNNSGKSVYLSDVCDINMGQSPSSSTYNTIREGLPFFQGKSEFSYKYAKPKTWCSKPQKIAQKGDILISVRAPVGIINIAPEKCCIGRGLASLRSDFLKLDQQYLWYLMNLKKEYFEGIAQGSTFDAISAKDIAMLPIKLPQISDQKKIAKILSSVENFIEKKRTKLEKNILLKNALINEFLLKGLNNKSFIDTPLGMIPSSWKICEFSSLLSFIKSGLSRRLSNVDIGIPVINSGNLQNMRLDVSNLKYWYSEDPQGSNIRDYLLDKDDILLNFINSTSQIGKSIIYKDIGRPAIYTTNIFRIKVGQKMLPKYLFLYMQSDKFKNCLRNITNLAVNQASFTKKDLSKILIPTPSLNEQEKICEIIDSMSLVEEELGVQLEKYNLIKEGLSKVLMAEEIGQL